MGWVAWGVGALVGVVMSMATQRRCRGLATAAAGLAGGGLLLGKLVITLGSTGAIAEEILHEEGLLSDALAWQKFETNELDPQTAATVVTTLEASDTLSDALWEQMNREATDRLAIMTDDEKWALAFVQAGIYVQQLGLVQSIRVQQGPFDLLWFGLALVTAFRMLSASSGRPA